MAAELEEVGAMNLLASYVHRYFFRACPPEELGYCRVAFYLWLSLFYLPLVDTYGSQDVSAFADVGEVFWHPIWPFNVLGLSVAPHPWIDLLAGTWKLSLLLSCLGLFSRASMVCAFVLGAYLIGLPFNFGKLSHTGGIVVIALGILALSRAGDAISLDAWQRRRAGRAAAEPSGEYRWPIRFVWVLVATVYFCSGASKLISSGLGYLDPDMMASFLRERHFAWYSRPLTDWGYRLAEVRWLCTAMAAWTLISETGFWVALVSRRARAVLVPGLFLSHVGIALLLGPQFFQFMSVYVFWVPWGAIAQRFAAREAESGVRADRAVSSSCPVHQSRGGEAG
jgi:hypothetical protein